MYDTVSSNIVKETLDIQQDDCDGVLRADALLGGMHQRQGCIDSAMTIARTKLGWGKKREFI